MFNLKSFSRSTSILNKHYHLPKLREIVYILRSLKAWEKLLFFFLSSVFIISSLLFLWEINKNFLVDVPAPGGVLREGILGTPRFINPLLEISGADKDLVNLIYSGLMRPNNKGELVPDLAEKYEVSEDGLVYTFTLKSGLLWHDKELVTVDDVIFTIEQAKDVGLKSSKRAK